MLTDKHEYIYLKCGDSEREQRKVESNTATDKAKVMKHSNICIISLSVCECVCVCVSMHVVYTSFVHHVVLAPIIC